MNPTKMTDPELRQTVYAFLAGIIFFGLLLLALPYLQYKQFIADCSEQYTEQECVSLWRTGNKDE